MKITYTRVNIGDYNPARRNELDDFKDFKLVETCCKKFKRVVEKDFDIDFSKGDSPNYPPVAVIKKYESEDLIFQLDYCPFCGTKIEFEQIEVQEYKFAEVKAGQIDCYVRTTVKEKENVS